MGFFEVSLPVGQYSLFVREDSLLYANWFDGHGNIWPVSVIADSVIEAHLNITYESSY